MSTPIVPGASDLTLNPTVGVSGDVVEYTFHADAGQEFAVWNSAWTITGGGSFAAPQFSLKRPDGSTDPSVGAWSSGDGGIDWRCPQSGTYTLIVGTTTALGTFDYTIHVFLGRDLTLYKNVPGAPFNVDVDVLGEKCTIHLLAHAGASLTINRDTADQHSFHLSWIDWELRRPDDTREDWDTWTNAADWSKTWSLGVDGEWTFVIHASASYGAYGSMRVTITGLGFDPWIFYINPGGLSSDESVGHPALFSAHAFLHPPSITPTAAVGTPRLTGERIMPHGIASQAAVGKPSIIPNPVFPDGIPSAERVGVPWLLGAGAMRFIFPDEWADSEAIGELSLVDAGPTTIYPVSIA